MDTSRYWQSLSDQKLRFLTRHLGQNRVGRNGLDLIPPRLYSSKAIERTKKVKKAVKTKLKRICPVKNRRKLQRRCPCQKKQKIIEEVKESSEEFSQEVDALCLYCNDQFI